MDKRTNDRREPLWIPYSTPPQTRRERLGASIRRYSLYIGVVLAVVLFLGAAAFVFMPETARQVQRRLALNEWVPSSLAEWAPGSAAGDSSMARPTEAASSPGSPYEGEALVSISSQPAGATVLLGRDTLGVTPLRRKTVEAGAQLLSVRMDGYASTDSVMLFRNDRSAMVYVTLQEQEGGTFSSAQPADPPATAGPPPEASNPPSETRSPQTADATRPSAPDQQPAPQDSAPSPNADAGAPTADPPNANPQSAGAQDTANAQQQGASGQQRASGQPPARSGSENGAAQQDAQQAPPSDTAASQPAQTAAGAPAADSDSIVAPDEDSMFFEDESLMRLYRAHMERGNELFDQERYRSARDAFERALAVRPDDASARYRLRKINDILDQAARDRERYAYHRAQGDLLFDQEQYQAAVERYENALRFKPGDPYVTRRLEAARPRARRNAEAARAKDAVRNSVPRRIDTPGQDADGEAPRVDLNAATAAQLQDLPGIGSALAQTIVEDRGERGPFQSVRDLERVPGVEPETAEELASFLFVQ